MKQEHIRKRIDELLAPGTSSQSKAIAGHEIFNGALSMMAFLYGPQSPQVQDLREKGQSMSQRFNGEGLSHNLGLLGRGALQNLSGEIDAGLIGSIQRTVTGEVLTDFLQLSRAALNEPGDGAKNVAAVLSAALFEDTLRRIYGKTYYGFNVRMIMKHLAEWADKENIPGPIHYVFAELTGQGNELDRVFRRVLKTPASKKFLRLTGMWSKGLMRDVSQLQAADIVAYELNKRVVNHVGTSPKFVRQSLDNLAAGLYGARLAPLYFGGKELIKLQEEILTSKPRSG